MEAFRSSGPELSLRDPAMLNWFGGGEMTESGIEVTPDMAMRLAAVYACIGVLSRSIAQLPLFLYRRGTGKNKREKAADHPLYRLLHRRPASNLTSFMWRQMEMAHLCLRGNSYSQIVRNRMGIITEIRPWPANKVRVECDGFTRSYYFSTKYGEMKLPEREVLHHQNISLDGLVGLSPISACRETFGEGLSVYRMASRYLRNGINAPVYLTHPQALKKESVDNLSKWFKALRINKCSN